MLEVLRDTAPAALAAAVSANLNALNRNMARSPYAAIHEAPGFFRWRTRVPHPYFNGVILSAPPDAAAPARVREALAYFAGEGVAASTWWFDPGVAPASWAPLLTEHGLTLDEQLPGMAVTLADWGEALHSPPPSLQIRAVEDSATLRLWAET